MGFGGNFLRVRRIFAAGRGGSASGKIFNSATCLIKHGLQCLGSGHFKNSLKSVIHGLGRCGPSRFHGC
jgi:hypothetical protein